MRIQNLNQNDHLTTIKINNSYLKKKNLNLISRVVQRAQFIQGEKFKDQFSINKKRPKSLRACNRGQRPNLKNKLELRFPEVESI